MQRSKSESQDAKGAWYPGLEAIEREHTRTAASHIEGELPAELTGTLYRIGAGRRAIGSDAYAHWFDGDGMVSAFRLDGRGTASYSNRFVRTPQYERETHDQRMQYTNFGTLAPGGWWRNVGRKPKNPANTNTTVFADRLLAMWEGGRPYRLDPNTLETLGEENFGGGLPRGSFFSAHPKVDPRTGEMFNVGPVMGKIPKLRVWQVSPAGLCKINQTIVLDQAFMIHDFGLTEKHIIIVGGPFYLDVGKVLTTFALAKQPLVDCFTWHPEQATRIYVCDREGRHLPKIYEAPASVVFHVANAYEEGDSTVLDAVHYADDGALRIVVDSYHGRIPRDQPGQLRRYRLSPGAPVVSQTLMPQGVDFPRIDDQLTGHQYRYAYPLEFEANNFASSRVLKLDAQSGAVTSCDFGTGTYAGEPVFVRDPARRDEDGGWLLSLVYDAPRHKSFVGVVDAQTMHERARVHFDFHVPITFHGNWHAQSSPI